MTGKKLHKVNIFVGRCLRREKRDGRLERSEDREKGKGEEETGEKRLKSGWE